MSGINASSIMFYNIISSRKRAIKKKELERLLDNSEVKMAPLTENILL
jgi:hypothetical protein